MLTIERLGNDYAIAYAAQELMDITRRPQGMIID
jgi:hypothetical protein